MVNCLRLARLSLLTLLLVACSPLAVSSSPTPTAPPPTATVPTVTPTEAPTATTPSMPPAATAPPATPTETPVEATATPPPGPCEVVAESEVTVYQRPSSQARVFGTMTPGVRVLGEGRTADGWFGFDPGVAQAANVGVFRLRWVDGSSGVRLEGDCDALPELVGPPPGICFSMPMDEVQVYAAPDLSSEVMATMVAGHYAAVTGRAADGWARVDLSVGNTGLNVTGWIEGGTLNLNGPCENLPTVEP
jgi:hypothetical protein